MRNSTPSYVDKNKVKHILVIRLSAMGDVAMTVPVLLAFTKTYPRVQLTVLTKAFFAPIFEDIPNVTVHLADVHKTHKGVLGLFRLYKTLKALKIDSVADLHNVLRSTILKQFFRLNRIAFVQIDKGRKEKKQLLNLKGAPISPLKTTHERYADVFKKLGFPVVLENHHVLSKKTPTSQIEGWFKNYIGIAPFAAFEGKMYPLTLMEEVIKLLNEKDNYTIVLFGGGQKEIQLLNTWETKYKNCLNVAGKYSFSEELTLIASLKIMLAMDSGNAHLAAMYGVPTVTLWGVTHPYAGFYPYGQDVTNCLLANRDIFPLIPTSIYGNKFPPGYSDVMKTIRPSDVFDKIMKILK